ncbi:HNH endonuclease family protein [Paeniglutamicibacter sp. NPDC012692]|uniref:HNH endonuclease family protein n=1 Tax=Paeniglutamicibacter sp. NPDC012692 TaxID=3364388 RepID=UPI0036B5D61E
MTAPLRGARWLALGTVLAWLLSGCGAQGAAAPAAEPLAIHSEGATHAPITTWTEEPTPAATTTPAARPSPTPRRAPAPATSAPPRAAPENGSALAQLATIPVKGRGPRTGYDRDLFGAGWKDPDRNGCDARNDILGRDLLETTAKPGTHGCVITSGTLRDPFTGKTIDFVRGQGTSTRVQIDHVVALSDAWQKGAQQRSAEERLAFANDPLNLLAVDGPTNASKGDGDAATWLPPNKGFRCDYVARQTAVKAKHELWMTRAEHDAIHRTLTTQCPDHKAVPTDDH